jgi:hypothetical protein
LRNAVAQPIDAARDKAATGRGQMAGPMAIGYLK